MGTQNYTDIIISPMLPPPSLLIGRVAEGQKRKVKKLCTYVREVTYGLTQATSGET